MENTYKLIIKYLKKKKWIFDGTQYVFRTTEWNELLNKMKCSVDCVLPKKGQSYTTAKFNYDIERIMRDDVYDMFDKKINFKIDFFVDGEIAKNVYLSADTKQKIRDGLKKVNWFKIKGKPPIDTKFSCELKVYPSNREPSTDYEYVTFYYFWDVFNITFNDIPVEVEESHYDDAKGYIDTLMMDNDFSSDIADIFFVACEDDFKFQNTDMYISATGYLRKIDGVDNGHGVWYNNKNPTNFFRQRT